MPAQRRWAKVVRVHGNIMDGVEGGVLLENTMDSMVFSNSTPPSTPSMRFSNSTPHPTPSMGYVLPA